jgi:hypothetical protein
MPCEFLFEVLSTPGFGHFITFTSPGSMLMVAEGEGAGVVGAGVVGVGVGNGSVGNAAEGWRVEVASCPAARH